MHSAFKSGSPVSLVLGKGSDAVEIEVALTPKQCDMLDGGAKRIKFSPAQLRKMHGMGVFSDLGEMATPLAEEGISAGLNAVAPGLGEIAGPILGEVIGPLIKKVGNEIDYAVSKKPNFGQLSKNRTKAKAKAQRYAAADESGRAADYAQVQKTFANAPKMIARRLPIKSQAAYESRLAKNLDLETNEGKIKSAHKAAFMEKLNEGSGKKRATPKGGYRRMPPGSQPIGRIELVGGMSVGKQAADYIRKSLLSELKN